jgi:hypothetical protein
MRLPRNSSWCAGVPSDPNFTVKLQADGQQLSVNRESATLFAMKYAIGEILFLAVLFGITFRPGTSTPRTTAESLSEVSHEVCDWQKLLSRPSLRCVRVMGGETVPSTRSFPGPCGVTKIEVSHERFDWPKIL